MKKFTIIYHNDLDGHCSGAIAKQYLADNNPLAEFQLIEASYSNVPDIVAIDSASIVFVLDYAFDDPNDFQQLIDKVASVTWIDHHKSAIEKYNDLDTQLKGVRQVGVAACELTWQYFYARTSELPSIVFYIGDMDVWKFSSEKTLALTTYLECFDTNPANPGFAWAPYLNPKRPLKMSYIEYDAGNDILAYVETHNTKLASNAYPAKWGPYNCIVCNCSHTGSAVFDSLKDLDVYDLMITYNWNGQVWNVSLYSTKNDIDLVNLLLYMMEEDIKVLLDL